MNPKIEMVLGIFLLAVLFPGAVWVVWDGIRTGETRFASNSGTGLSPGHEFPASRNKTPGFFWFTTAWYVLGGLLFLCFGLWGVMDAMHQLREDAAEQNRSTRTSAPVLSSNTSDHRTPDSLPAPDSGGGR